MQIQKFYRFACLLLLVQSAFVVSLHAQAENAGKMKPDLSIMGIELGNRESARKVLSNGYQPKVGEDGRASFYFYNKWATQVLRLTAPSIEDKYFITELEVFRVNRSYLERHYQSEETKYFQTESGIFIGFKQSAMFLLAGIENVGAVNRFEPKHLIKLKGEPDARTKTDKKRETLFYKLPRVILSDKETDAKYEANFEFYKKKLRRFTLRIVLDKERIAKA